jgi:hypothetical protein
MVAHAYPHLQAYGGNVASVHHRGNYSIPIMWDQVHLSWIKGQGMVAFDENIQQLLVVSWERDSCQQLRISGHVGGSPMAKGWVSLQNVGLGQIFAGFYVKMPQPSRVTLGDPEGSYDST